MGSPDALAIFSGSNRTCPPKRRNCTDRPSAHFNRSSSVALEGLIAAREVDRGRACFRDQIAQHALRLPAPQDQARSKSLEAFLQRPQRLGQPPSARAAHAPFPGCVIIEDVDRNDRKAGLNGGRERSVIRKP